MKASNNLNQLISRVKSIFGRKAAPVATIIQTKVPPTDLSVVSAPRLKPAFAEVRKYLAERYGTTASALTYKDYANGAMLVSNDETLGMALIILNTSEGLKNLPDNVMILGYVNSPTAANGSYRNLETCSPTSKLSASNIESSTSPSPSALKSPTIPPQSKKPT